MRDEELPELGVVKTATPCNVSWDSMSGDSVKRYCGKCKLHVWNFSELTTDEARALLVETEGRLCGRIFTRPDGTMLTRDCPTGVSKQRKKKLGGIAAAVALLGGAATTAVAAYQSTCPIASGNPGGQMMGAMVMAPPPPQTAKPPHDAPQKERDEMREFVGQVEIE
jgi:hypothetical protein